ncbi:MAG: 2-oxoacid:acceptor oxidoreductase family protein [Candidatus Omnitrophica bacterium]|nr:2-oxoacid:acceptor oxidoreductase family protein [Candidatus Omnitrophota bacterium]
MKDLLEIRWHGRGGQGAKTAAQFLAEAALELGKYIQAFPEYGPERAGAPIRSYTRISDKPINIHSPVTNPDVVAVVDPTLLDTIDVTNGLGDDGILVVNTHEDVAAIRKKTNFKKGKVAVCNATKISLEILKIPMPNTPMLGALLKVRNIVPIENLENEVKKKFLKKIGQEKTDGNIKAIRRAHKEVKIG